MDLRKNSREHCVKGIPGLEIKCYRCGKSLPLLHPHIILERTDEDENLICEECYEEQHSLKRNTNEEETDADRDQFRDHRDNPG